VGAVATPGVDVDIDGGLMRLRTDYDPQLVARIKQLPDRRYVPDRTEWVLPARRPALAALAGMVAELDGQVHLSDRARRRLERQGPGRIEINDGEIEVTVTPRPRKLAQIKAVPERKYLPDRRRWLVPPTRAAALALLTLVGDAELVATPAANGLLQRLATARPQPTEDPPPEDDAAQGQYRASPTPHWRHVTRGAVFDANPHRHEWVDGIGWCVRIRVDPAP